MLDSSKFKAPLFPRLASPPPESELVHSYKTSFETLVDDIKRILGPSSGIDSADVDVDTLMETLRAYDCTREHEWSKYALADPQKNYTRNGVDDINRKANLLILVWNPGKGSAIHDHANAHCIVKMLKGTLRETLYEWPEELKEGECPPQPHEMVEKRNTDYGAGQVSYMSDQLGLHRMYNPDPDNVAISLHLYTPPYAAKFGCRVFDEHNGLSHKVMTPLYSDKGVKIERNF